MSGIGHRPMRSVCDRRVNVAVTFKDQLEPADKNSLIQQRMERRSN
jgi:hypothetical protein